ncbi:Hypothetical protein CINCED_3A022819 [Cinara cedri]|uniref:Uncharacterized protein n=1 Tax=Cinara cedri TaxID=506608 RepID=A0A5E4LWZ8_9HEMI|nr:Hypothetical protein CINCED_3A022819 [Cinara cedri]
MGVVTVTVVWETAAAVAAVAETRPGRFSSVDRVIYKALVRPPQVITSARPELGFLPTQHSSIMRPELPGFRSSDPFY